MRILHTMLRVGDLEKSIAFYTEVLGMTLLRRKDYPDGRFTNAFVGYGNEAEHAVLELTWNWDTSSYDLGSGYGHIAIEVLDVYRACEQIRAAAPRHRDDAAVAANRALRTRWVLGRPHKYQSAIVLAGDVPLAVCGREKLAVLTVPRECRHVTPLALNAPVAPQPAQPPA